MGLGRRIFVIDSDDKILRVSTARFDKFHEAGTEIRCLKFKNTLIRYADIGIVFQNQKPARFNNSYYGVLKIDSEGKIEEAFAKELSVVSMYLIPPISAEGKKDNVISAKREFYRKIYENKFMWEPSAALEKRIFEKIFK